MERYAMKRYLPFALLFAALFLFAARVSAAENEGQDDLDKATEKKLSSESLNDLSEVLTLCESAMKKGLSPVASNPPGPSARLNCCPEGCGQSRPASDDGSG